MTGYGTRPLLKKVEGEKEKRMYEREEADDDQVLMMEALSMYDYIVPKSVCSLNRAGGPSQCSVPPCVQH